MCNERSEVMMFYGVRKIVAGLNIIIILITPLWAGSMTVKENIAENHQIITELEKVSEQYVFGASSRERKIKRVYKKMGKNNLNGICR